MLSLAGIRVLIEMRAVKQSQAMIVTREMVETPGELPDIEGAIAKMKELA